MKYKFSFLNIEYGSINLINILKSFFVFFKYIFFSNEYVENKLESNMRYTKIDKLVRIGLQPYLEELRDEMNDLSREIDMIYFNTI